MKRTPPPGRATERNRELLATLRVLGRTPNEIAETLEAKGVQGHRSMADSCPVAVFLQEQFPDYKPIISATIAQLYDRGHVDPQNHFVANLETPEPVAEFITEFDFGRYPALISDEALPDDDEYPQGFVDSHTLHEGDSTQ